MRIGKRDELPFIDAYKLSLDVKIRQRALRTDIVVDTLTPEVRAKTNEAIGFVKKVLSELKTAQSLEVKTASSIRTATMMTMLTNMKTKSVHPMMTDLIR